MCFVYGLLLLRLCCSTACACGTNVPAEDGHCGPKGCQAWVPVDAETGRGAPDPTGWPHLQQVTPPSHISEASSVCKFQDRAKNGRGRQRTA